MLFQNVNFKSKMIIRFFHSLFQQSLQSYLSAEIDLIIIFNFISRAQLPKAYLFHDDTLTSFFRRLAWSPDGSFLLVPSGIDPVN